MTTEKNQKFIDIMTNPVKMGFFMFAKLPSAWFSGVRVKHLEAGYAEITVPFKWFSQNPFKSTYFACQSMAAEMSTGMLVMMNTYERQPSVSMLVLNVNGSFHKKATGRTTFRCNDGNKIREAVELAIANGEGVIVDTSSVGVNDKGEIISTFDIRWSFKAKK